MATIKKIYKNGVEYQMPQGPKGGQGDSAVFDPSTGNIATMKQTTGDDTESPMSQKAITDTLDELARNVTEVEYEYPNSSWIITGDNPNKWQKATTSKTARTTVVAGRKYYIKTQANVTTYYAWLTTPASTTPSAGVVQNFCIGYEERIALTAEQGKVEITAPDDAKSIYLLTKTSNGTLTGIQLWEVVTVIEMVEEEAVKRDKAIDDAMSILVEREPNKTDSRWFINSSDEWQYATSNQTYRGARYEYVKPNQAYVITTTLASNYAWLKEIPQLSASVPVPFCVGYAARIDLVAEEEVEVVSPSDAKVFAFYERNGQGNYTGTKLYEKTTVTDVLANIEDGDSDGGDRKVEKRIADIIGNKLTPYPPSVDENGWELPTTREERDVLRRSKQFTDIKWIPKADLPYKGDSTTRVSGRQQTGLPYSSVKECDKFIGVDVSIHTFMTAINNPYSLLYTEDVRSGVNSKSAWGFTYHGSNCDMYMGTVCSILTAYATCQEPYYPTNMQQWVADNVFSIIKLYRQNKQAFRLGDIWRGMVGSLGHNMLVTRIQHNADGDVSVVKMSESHSPNCEANSTMPNGGEWYRNTELYKVVYEASQYVAVDGETPEEVTYNNDICTFAGDKATYKEGELVVINYNLDGSHGGWTAMEVYKDGTISQTYTLANIDQSALPESQQGHALKLTGLEAGKYKARMSDGNGNYSEYTEWEMLQCDVSATSDNGIQHITWATDGKAMSITVSENDGTRYAVIALDDEDRANGYIDVNIKKMIDAQTGESIGGHNLYLKVHFQGDYGKATNIGSYGEYDSDYLLDL